MQNTKNEHKRHKIHPKTIPNRKHSTIQNPRKLHTTNQKRTKSIPKTSQKNRTRNTNSKNTIKNRTPQTPTKSNRKPIQNIHDTNNNSNTTSNNTTTIYTTSITTTILLTNNKHTNNTKNITKTQTKTNKIKSKPYKHTHLQIKGENMSYNPQQPDPKRLEELLKQQPQITKEIQQTIEHINQKIEKIKDERSKETIKKYWQPVIDSLITLNKHIQTMTTHITQLPRIGAENLWQDIWNTGLSITQTAVDIYYHIKYILLEVTDISQNKEIKELIPQTYMLLKQLYTLTVCP